MKPLIKLDAGNCRPLFITPSEAFEEYLRSTENEALTPRQQRLRKRVNEGIYFLEYITGILKEPGEDLTKPLKIIRLDLKGAHTIKLKEPGK